MSEVRRETPRARRSREESSTPSLLPAEAPAQRLYLVDGSSYVFRAFHAIPFLSTSKGIPTNAVLGFTTMCVKLLREEKPSHVAMVFDAPGGTFRDEMYAE